MNKVMYVTLWVTTDCNLNCRYCYEGINKANKTVNRNIIDQSIEFIMNYFDFQNITEFNLNIHGGEPFLAFDEIKYLVYKFKKIFKRNNINILFAATTNATLFNEEIIEFIVNEIPDITISLDGTKSTHDKMRLFKNGKGSYDIVKKNSLKLLKYLPNLRVRMTFDSNTAYNLYEDVKSLMDLGFRFIVAIPNLYDKNWNTEHINNLEEQIKYIKEYQASFNDTFINLTENKKYFFKTTCNGGKTHFQIYPDGKIYPCIVSAGNDEFQIGDIYNGIDYKKRDNILEKSYQLNQVCHGCKIYNYCDGPRSKIINKLITNNYCIPPYMVCALENLQYKMYAT